jgi:hypothetical protein
MRHFLQVTSAVPVLLLPSSVTTTARATFLVQTSSLAQAVASSCPSANVGAIAIPPVTEPAQRKDRRTPSTNTAEDVHQAGARRWRWTSGLDHANQIIGWFGRRSVNPSERPGAPTLGLSLAVASCPSSTLHIGPRQHPAIGGSLALAMIALAPFAMIVSTSADPGAIEGPAE